PSERITVEFRWPREWPSRWVLSFELERRSIAAHLQRFVRQWLTGLCTPMKRSRSCKLCGRLGEVSFAWPAAQAEESLRREGPGRWQPPLYLPARSRGDCERENRHRTARCPCPAPLGGQSPSP